jgi:hypothetical protein
MGSPIKVGRGEHADVQLPDDWIGVSDSSSGQFNLLPLPDNRIQVFGEKGDHPTWLIPANRQRVLSLKQQGYETITFRGGEQAIKLKSDPARRLRVYPGDSIRIYAGPELKNVDIKLEVPQAQAATTST